MNILITGATGFIGSHLVERLLEEKKHKLILIKRKTSDIWRIKDFINKCLVYDYDKLEDLDKIFFQNQSIDVVIHLASFINRENEDKEKKIETIKTNITFPVYLLEKCVEAKIKYFINTGSFFEYKRSSKPINERLPLEPFNFYAASKISFETFLKYYCYSKKIKAITLKLAYPFGEKDNKNRFINILMKSFIKSELIETTKCEQKWDFIYVKDVVEAYIKAINYLKNLKEYEVFNIGTGKVFYFKKIIEKIRKITKMRGKILIGKKPYRINEIMFFRFDIKKAKEKLKWEPKFTIDEGLMRTFNYYKEFPNRL